MDQTQELLKRILEIQRAHLEYVKARDTALDERDAKQDQEQEDWKQTSDARFKELSAVVNQLVEKLK